MHITSLYKHTKGTKLYYKVVRIAIQGIPPVFSGINGKQQRGRHLPQHKLPVAHTDVNIASTARVSKESQSKRPLFTPLL